MSSPITLDFALKYMLDPATAALVIIPLLAIFYGAYRSISIYEGATVTPELRELQRQSVVVPKTAVCLPIIGSVILIILFFFLNLVYYLLLLLLLVMSMVAVAFVLWPIVTFFLTFVRRFVNVPQNLAWLRCIGTVDTEALFVIPAISTLFVAFLWTNHWMISNVFALSIGAFGLSLLRVPSLKVATIMLIIFFGYDIFWVFFSQLIFGENVMKEVATKVATQYKWKLPMTVIIPRLLTGGYSLLGMGDILLPGYLLCFLYRFDRKNSGGLRCGYFINACIGYAIGMLLTLSMLLALNGMAQPALTYLVPCTLVPTFLMGFMRKELQQLWKGSTGTVRKVPARNADPSSVEMEAMGDSSSSSLSSSLSVDSGSHPPPSSLDVSTVGDIEIQLSPEEREERESSLKTDPISFSNPFSDHL